ncbi:MAG: ATP--guanido phosphotransferase [Planctomycetota bacterium]|nr:MAG: ATP--guanido phosphotransferase [Planctomycetota bacterium]
MSARGHQHSLFPADDEGDERSQIDPPALWIANPGPEHDVAVSSRVRLARNIEDFHFRSRYVEGEGERLEVYLRDRLLSLVPELEYHTLNDLTPSEREVFFERHLVSREHVKAEERRGVAFSRDGRTSIMVNEEDHLRLAVFAPGLDVDALAQRADALDERLAASLRYSFSPKHGFLTSCPTNTGTGLRVSVMLHLPALSFRSSGKQRRRSRSRDIVRVHNAARDLDLTVRGLHGESSRADGDFYQISNQVTLGRPVQEIVDAVNALARKVVIWERSSREIHHQESCSAIEDHVWRAWGLLTHVRRLSSGEALGHLSAVRLGVCLGIIDLTDLATIQRLQVLMRPGHLQWGLAHSLDASQRDEVRARLVRATLGKSVSSS